MHHWKAVPGMPSRRAILRAAALSEPFVFAALLVLCAIGLALYGAIAWLESRVRQAWRG
jgi:ABC-type nitrate/sulfonate/bicarbonate transport system permease component